MAQRDGSRPKPGSRRLGFALRRQRRAGDLPSPGILDPGRAGPCICNSCTHFKAFLADTAQPSRGAKAGLRVGRRNTDEFAYARPSV